MAARAQASNRSNRRMFAIIKHRMKIAVEDDYAGFLLEARILA
jgi:hypothetical protein